MNAALASAEKKSVTRTARPLIQRSPACGSCAHEAAPREEDEFLRCKTGGETKSMQGGLLASSQLRAAGAPAFLGLNWGQDFSRVQVGVDTGTKVPHSNAYMTGPGRGIEKLMNMVFTCPPAPDSVTSTAGVAGAGTLGWTKIDKSSSLICGPRFDVDATAGTGTLKAVSVNLSTTSKFAKPETEAPTGPTQRLPECGQKDVPIFTTITPDISKLVQAGEQEHCDDLNLAFKQTLEPCAAAVNKLAGQKFPGKSEGECYKALVAKLGFDPLDCTTEFVTLSKKTDERDSSSNGWHDFDPTLISKSCDKIVVGNKKSATNKIGDPGVAPGKLISASTKCGVAAPPPVVPPSNKPVSPAPSSPPPSPKSTGDAGTAAGDAGTAE